MIFVVVLQIIWETYRARMVLLPRAYGKQGEIRHSGKYNTSNDAIPCQSLFCLRKRKEEMALRAENFVIRLLQSMALSEDS